LEAGRHRAETRTLADGRTIPVFVLANDPVDRRFLLTNPDGYPLTYDGLVMVVERRRSHGWQAFGSYTLSRAFGMQASSGTSASGAQASTVAPPQPPTFGRDPNDLTNPHMVRVMGSIDVSRVGVTIAANLQHLSGKPWAATAQIALPQGAVRMLVEPRGTRRLSSQSLLDVRVSRTIAVHNLGRIELLVDVLNALDDTAEEGLATDNLFSPAFGHPTAFLDPRRAMIGMRLHLGR
jgi:hypothetical protein